MQSRNTRQREYILNCLKENANNHLTIQDIEILLLRKSMPVSTATIYRQLDKLVNSNIVRKFKLDGQNSACYQYIENCSSCCSHFHLICSRCSKTIHFQNEKLNNIFNYINENNDFKIDFPKTVFYGLCEKCAHSQLSNTLERR